MSGNVQPPIEEGSGIATTSCNKGIPLQCAVCVCVIPLVLPQHIPYLLKSLEPVWYKWELFGTALKIPSSKLQNIKPDNQTSCQDKLLTVIQEFGKMTGFKECTWQKVYDAVMCLDRRDVASKIEEDHKNLSEPCKLLCVRYCHYDAY